MRRLGTVVVGAAVLAVMFLGPAGAAPQSRPVVTMQPRNAVASKPRVSFNARASGAPAPKIQWYTRQDSGWVAVNGATRYTFIAPATVGAKYRAIFTNKYGSATTKVVEVAPPPGSTTTTATTTTTTTTTTPADTNSPEWSGYVATGAPYSAISGSWNVPSVTCGAANTSALVWVGIDGWGTGSVEQAGTFADCVGGVVQTSAFYEMWGDAAENNGLWVDLPTGYPVSPGDQISVEVSYTASGWMFTLVDATQGWNYSTTVAEPSRSPKQFSAEAIVEDPLGCTSASACVLDQLAQFSPVTFTNLSSTGPDGVNSLTGATRLTMESGSTVEAQPGALTSGSFTDTWESSAQS